MDGVARPQAVERAEFDRTADKMRGLVLFFDEDLVLTSYRSGLLRDLTRDLRPPPAFLEDDDEDRKKAKGAATPSGLGG